MVTPVADLGKLEFVFRARGKGLERVKTRIAGVGGVGVGSRPEIGAAFVFKKYVIPGFNVYGIGRKLAAVVIYFRNLDIRRHSFPAGLGSGRRKIGAGIALGIRRSRTGRGACGR